MDNFNANRKKLKSSNNNEFDNIECDECTIKLSIDPEFEELITKPNDAEYSMLKDSIIKEGIRETIIVWNNTIIDGHNWYKIAQELGIPVKYKTIQFENKEEAKEWIISNQLGRRNISK